MSASALSRLGLAVLFICGSAPASGQTRAKVTLAPSTLVLGQDPGAEISVVVEGAESNGPPRFAVSLGTVTGSTFTPGSQRTPGVAIVAAAVPLVTGGEARGAAIVELVAPARLMTHTSPGAQVTVEVAGRTFGPTIADREGNAPVTVQVPAEARTAHVHAVDGRGLKTSRVVELPAARFPLGLVLGPRRGRVGDAVTVTIFVMDGPGGNGVVPEVRVSSGLRLAGPARVVAAGIWEVPLTAVAKSPAASVFASVGGEELPRATFTIEDRPTVATAVRELPKIESAPQVWRGAGARLGGASALGPVRSALVALDLTWPVVEPLAVMGEVSFALGAASEFHGQEVATTLTQLHASLAGRVRFPLGGRLAADGFVGVGYAVSRSESGARTQEAAAPCSFAGLALSLRNRLGEVFLDLRWIELRFNEATRVEGNAMGLTMSAGHRFGF